MINQDMKKELLRKSVHLSSIVYPLLYLFIEKHFMVYMLAMLFVLVFLWDILRINNIELKLLSFINSVLREKEIKNKQFAGATWFLLSSFIVVTLFKKDVAIMALLILVICDTVAAIVGKSLGKTKILDKSLEGFASFIFFGVLIVLIYSLLNNFDINFKYIILSFIVVVITATSELIANKIKLDDNLLITIVFSISYTAII